MFQDFSQENLNEKKEWMQASTYSALSPRVFFFSLPFSNFTPFLSPHLNAGRRFTFFNLSRRSSICWIAKSRIFLTSTSHIVFLSSSRSSICLIKISTRMLEKIPEQHDSSRHVHLVSFCSTRELSLFLSLKHATSFSSSIFLPSSNSLIFPSQVSSTRELPLSMKLHLQRRRSRDTRDKKFLACIRLSALPWISFPIRC